MKKIYKSVALAVAFVIGAQALTACALVQKEKKVDTLAVGTFAVDDVSVHVTNLVTHEMLPNDNLISIDFTQMLQEKEKYLGHNVAEALIKKGYAIEKVLPEKERQKGDVSDMTASGVPLIINLVPLQESNLYEMKVKLNGIFYYRMYALTDGKMVPVSAWSQAGV